MKVNRNEVVAWTAIGVVATGALLSLLYALGFLTSEEVQVIRQIEATVVADTNTAIPLLETVTAPDPTVTP